MKRVCGELQNLVVLSLFLFLLFSLNPIKASSLFNPVDEMGRFLSAHGCVEQLQTVAFTAEQIKWHSMMESLQELKRSGWLRRGIPRELAESVLEHSWKVRTAAVTYGKTKTGINVERVERMSVVHDIAEIITGDPTPADRVLPEEKYAKELAALKSLAGYFGAIGDEMVSVWIEFEAAQTSEAKLVKQLDRLDAAVQAVVYARMGYHATRDFYDYTRQRIQDPRLLAILEEVIRSEGSTVNLYELYFQLLSQAPDSSN